MTIPFPRVCKTEESGFTLVEVLVAVVLFVGAVVIVAQVATLVAASTLDSRALSYGKALGAQKLGELLSTSRETLPNSPADAWMRSSDGAFEYLDAAGVVVGTDGSPPGTARYVRRWSIVPLASDPANSLTIAVSVQRLRGGALARALRDGGPDFARAVGISTRMAP